jgi:hypothetical protein
VSPIHGKRKRSRYSSTRVGRSDAVVKPQADKDQFGRAENKMAAVDVYNTLHGRAHFNTGVDCILDM